MGKSKIIAEWTKRFPIKKAEHQRIDAFKLWCWRRPSRVSWTSRRSNQSILKETHPEYLLEGLMLKLNLRWPPEVRSQLTGKGPDAGNYWGQEEKGVTKDEIVGWLHWLDGHEFEQAPGVGDEQGSLACCSPWSYKAKDRLSDWTTTNLCNQLEKHCDSLSPMDLPRWVMVDDANRKKASIGMIAGVPENLNNIICLQQVWAENEDWLHPLSVPGVRHSGARTHVCCVGGRRCDSRSDYTSHHLGCMWRWSPETRMGRGGEGVCLMLSVTLLPMTSRRLIFSWCFCALAAFWHESNVSEMEKEAWRNQPWAVSYDWWLRRDSVSSRLPP